MSEKKKSKKKKKSRYHRGIYLSNFAGECKYRSGWELKVMQYLDGNDEVEFWTYEKTIIEYISNIKTRKIRRYYPDFFVKYKDGRVEVIEVKQKRKLDQKIVKKKTEAANEWCLQRGYSYKIITEIELKELGLI